MSQHAAHSTSNKNQPPPIDPAIQNKLIAKFGAKIMKQGFTALPRLVQDHFRYVPGNPYLVEMIDTETGEIRQVERISHMTPTEYVVMTAIWSFWWNNQSNPWPSAEHIREKVGKSERQVRRYLQRLRDKGFMLSVEQYNGEGKQISNRYDFTPFLKRLVAYLDALEVREKPVQGTTRDDKNTGQWMSDQPGSGCQNDQGKQIENETNISNRDESNSSGFAASQKGTVLPPSPPENLSPGEAIRNSKEETEENQPVELHRTSNRPPTSQEMGASEQSKEVGDKNTSKKVSKWEEFVLASGVPLAELEDMEMWLKVCPRPERTPRLVQSEIDRVSQRFDNAHLVVSNRTQATKLYLYMRTRGFEQEELDDCYREWIPLAERRVPPHVSHKMAWFFRALKVEALKAVLTRTLASETVVEAPEEPSEPEASLTSDEAIHQLRRTKRTNEQKEVRECYAKQVRDQLRKHGVPGSFDMMIDREHIACGCPLYNKEWKCVHCHPDGRWEQDILAYIDSILEH